MDYGNGYLNMWEKIRQPFSPAIGPVGPAALNVTACLIEHLDILILIAVSPCHHVYFRGREGSDRLREALQG